MNWLIKQSQSNLVDILDQMQASKNDGRGLDCIKTLITYLRMGNINAAKAVCLNEGDKISSYPDIVNLLKQMDLWWKPYSFK